MCERLCYRAPGQEEEGGRKEQTLIDLGTSPHPPGLCSHLKLVSQPYAHCHVGESLPQACSSVNQTLERTTGYEKSKDAGVGPDNQELRRGWKIVDLHTEVEF